MKILKFGGTSLGSAQRIKNAVLLIDERSSNVVVLSAMSGITNALSDIYTDLIGGSFQEAKRKLEAINNHFNETAYQLFDENEYLNEALVLIKREIKNIADKLDLIKLKEIQSYGELITSSLFS
jgi:aspartate kinase